MSEDRPAESSAGVVRDATLADVPALNICYDKANHENRIRASDGKASRYVVIEVNREVVGFGRLVFTPAAHHPHAAYLPKIVSLNVREDMRRRGLASSMVRAMERMAAAAGHHVLHIGAHRNCPRTVSLYQKLGYQPIEEPPAADAPDFEAREEIRRAGIVYMVKHLG